MSRPAYIALLASGELAERAQQLQAILRDCTLCPRCCHANRLQGEIGKCRSTAEAIISSAGPHFGEEPELVGLGGSGTIFFTNCNLWHLVLPNDLAGSEAILRFVAEEISPDSYVNIMDQYHPAFKAYHIPELARRISIIEYHCVIQLARELGLHRGFNSF